MSGGRSDGSVFGFFTQNEEFRNRLTAKTAFEKNAGDPGIDLNLLTPSDRLLAEQARAKDEEKVRKQAAADLSRAVAGQRTFAANARNTDEAPLNAPAAQNTGGQKVIIGS